MPAGRIRYIQRHRLKLPIFEQRHSLTLVLHGRRTCTWAARGLPFRAVPTRCAGAGLISRRGKHAQWQIRDLAGHQRLIQQFTALHHAIDVFINDIDDANTNAHVELHIRAARVKFGQYGHQNRTRRWARHIDAQPYRGYRCRARQTPRDAARRSFSS